MGFIHPYDRRIRISAAPPRSAPGGQLLGRGRYTDDITPPRTFRGLRAQTYAHARILKIDVEPPGRP